MHPDLTIRENIRRIHRLSEAWIRDGKEATIIITAMQHFMSTASQSGLKEAEPLLDDLIRRLNPAPDQKAPQTQAA